eukprot:2912650-Pleurochrysis_carterae.AAC.1
MFLQATPFSHPRCGRSSRQSATANLARNQLGTTSTSRKALNAYQPVARLRQRHLREAASRTKTSCSRKIATLVTYTKVLCYSKHWQVLLRRHWPWFFAQEFVKDKKSSADVRAAKVPSKDWFRKVFRTSSELQHVQIASGKENFGRYSTCCRLAHAISKSRKSGKT